MVAALPTRDSIRKLTARFPGLTQSIALVSAYLTWNVAYRVISTALVTYFVLSTSASENSHFDDVNEALSSTQFALLAICSGSFLLLFRLFQPYTLATTEEILTRKRFETQYFPGFLHGSVLALGVTLAFLLSGIYRYLGFFVQTERAPLAITSILIRMLSIAVLVYSEEFIFRGRILRALSRRDRHATSRQSEFWQSLGVVAFTGLAYVGIKLIQFDLSTMQALSLFLISMALGMRTLAVSDFALGAGFWSAALIIFNAWMSLPVLGSEFSGLILIKYQAPAALAGTDGTSADTLRFITGGAGGPLASFAFQCLLILDVFRGLIRYRKRMFNPRNS